jgi:putative peptidoglycan lipid II flippase
MFKRILTRQQTSILSAAFIIGSMVAASRILGLIRNRLLTDRFTEAQLDPYFAAFRIPNFVFEILIMGAISVAFIPVFTSFISKNEKNEAFKVASSVINISVIILGILSLIFFIFTPQFVSILVPGFTLENKILVASFARIMIIFQVLPLVVGNFITGILQSFKQFLIPALAPVVYNIGIIIGIIFLTPYFGLYGAVYGVVIGAFLFFLIQLPLLSQYKYKHSFIFDRKRKGVKQIGRLMLPRTVSIAASQVDATVDVILSSLMGAGSVTVFTLAQQLSLVPLGLFGLPIAQAALPTFSEYAARNDWDKLKDSLLTSLHQILFFILPASVFLVVMRIPVVRLVYGADLFTWTATVMTGRTLAFFSISLFAQAIVHLLSRGFFAIHDSKTPVVIALISILTNTLLSIVFVFWFHLPIWALALSASIASFLNASLLLIFLDRKLGSFDRIKLFLPAIKIGMATIIMGLSLYVPMKLLDQLVFDTTRTLNLILLTWTASCIGLATYLFCAWLFNIEEVILFIKFARKLTTVKDIFYETSGEVGPEKR